MQLTMKHAGQVAILSLSTLFAPGCSDEIEPKIVDQGAFSTLRLPNGANSSIVYHDLRVADELGGLLIGTLGAGHYIVDPLTGEPKNSEGFSQFERRQGLLLGQKGSLEYVVSPETGGILSKGYHAIGYVGSELVGRIGATLELVELGDLARPIRFPIFPEETVVDLNQDGFISLDQATLAPIHEGDQALLDIAPQSTMRKTILPSGSIVPDLPEGYTWAVVNGLLKITVEQHQR